jgi:SNF related kinase
MVMSDEFINNNKNSNNTASTIKTNNSNNNNRRLLTQSLSSPPPSTIATTTTKHVFESSNTNINSKLLTNQCHHHHNSLNSTTQPYSIIKSKPNIEGSGDHHIKTNKVDELYRIEGTIGQGHFAIVKLARHLFSGELVAIKVIDKTKLDSISRDHLFQEVRCMKRVQHANVVRLYEVIDTPNKLHIILELGDGGDMYDYIMKHTNGLTESIAKNYFRQIVNAVKYCHDLNVVHRDLKPENVVFFEQTGQVKLTDFGFSNIFEPGKRLLTSCGSLAYSAPEILLGDSYDAPSVDIWSLGVILYMLVTGHAPFQEANDSETLTMILDCKYYIPATLSGDCIHLITSMIVRDPNKRLCLDEIVKHQWFDNLNSNNIKSSFNNGSSRSQTVTTTDDDDDDDDDKDVEFKTKKNNSIRNENLMISGTLPIKRQNLSDKDNENIFKMMHDGKIGEKEEIIK